MASIPHMRTGPPFERLYAVEPDGVEQTRPSQATEPRSSPPTAHSSSTIRPRTADVTTTSLTATCSSPFTTSSVGRATTSSSPRKARVRPTSSSSGCIELRKPTRPKLTPITGTPEPRYVRSARSIVPSPPSTTTSSAARGSPYASSPCRAASSAATISSTPASPATVTTRSIPSPICSGRPCVTRAARVMGCRRLRDGGVDPAFELIGVVGLLGSRSGGRRTPGSPSAPGAPSLRRPRRAHPTKRRPRRRHGEPDDAPPGRGRRPSERRPDPPRTAA